MNPSQHLTLLRDPHSLQGRPADETEQRADEPGLMRPSHYLQQNRPTGSMIA